MIPGQTTLQRQEVKDLVKSLDITTQISGSVLTISGKRKKYFVLLLPKMKREFPQGEEWEEKLSNIKQDSKICAHSLIVEKNIWTSFSEELDIT